MITYKKEAAVQLAEQSKKQWVPAAEKRQMQREVDCAQNQLALAQYELQTKEAFLQAAELEVQILRSGNQNWEEANKQAQEARAQYEKLHKEIQNREDALTDKLLNGQKEANRLTAENAKLNELMMRLKGEIADKEDTIVKLRKELFFKNQATAPKVPPKYHQKKEPESPTKPKKPKVTQTTTTNPIS